MFILDIFQEVPSVRFRLSFSDAEQMEYMTTIVFGHLLSP